MTSITKTSPAIDDSIGSAAERPLSNDAIQTPTMIMHRQRSNEDDRIALISNLPKEATELTLRHFLLGVMTRKNLKQVGSEPPISMVRFLRPAHDTDEVTTTSPRENHAPSANTTALVQFATSNDCHVAVTMLEQDDGISFHGNKLRIEKLTQKHYVDHADRNESIRISINKSNGLSRYSTDYSKLDASHLKQEVERLEQSLALERVALHQLRNELSKEHDRQATADQLLAVEQAQRAQLESRVMNLANSLDQARIDTERLARLHLQDQSELKPPPNDGAAGVVDTSTSILNDKDIENNPVSKRL